VPRAKRSLLLPAAAADTESSGMISGCLLLTLQRAEEARQVACDKVLSNTDSRTKMNTFEGQACKLMGANNAYWLKN
jgi:hypothetical protein